MGPVTVLPRGREFTRGDLDAMPDDGHRYELVDGMLTVTPSPSPRHQGVSAELFFRLRSACPTHLRVRTAPLDVALSDNTVLQPDLLVAAPEAFSERDLLGAPLLAVEILSPATRLYDLTHKRAAFERAGTQSYWVVDPDLPSITAWELANGRYEQMAQAEGDQTFAVDLPFPISLRPVDLLD